MSDIIEKGVQLQLATNPVTMSTYWLYRLYRWCQSGPKEEIKVPAPTKDDGKAIPVQMTEGDQKKFETLMDFSMKQTTWKYTKKGTDGAIENQMDQTWDKEANKKDSGKPDGNCYTYVKAAFFISGITTITLTPTINAKLADKEFLIPSGFKPVTDECNGDPYLALPGDVIVYKKYAYTNTDLKNIKKADDYDKAEKAGKPLQSPKPKRPDKPEDHPGHIEIRTYDGFVSDFFSKDPVGSNAYQVVGIYRKVYDEKAKKRQDAFLKMLRILETKEDWYILNTPIDGNNHFSDTSEHPWLNRNKSLLPPKHTTAAGAYQITVDTYKEFINKSYYSADRRFDPAAQEYIAIRILESQGKSDESSLSLVRKGKIQESIEKTNLNGRWVCLPGGSQPQVKSMDAFLTRWRELL